MLQAELEDRERFCRLIDATVPEAWPPDLYEDRIVRFTLERVAEDSENADWWTWYNILQGSRVSKDTLIGTLGFKGPPDRSGVIEVGYGLLQEYRKNGYATEGVRGLLRWAFSHENVRSIRAQTLPGHHPSISVLERNGFRFIGTGSDDGLTTVVFELTCMDFTKGRQQEA